MLHESEATQMLHECTSLRYQSPVGLWASHLPLIKRSIKYPPSLWRVSREVRIGDSGHAAQVGEIPGKEPRVRHARLVPRRSTR